LNICEHFEKSQNGCKTVIRHKGETESCKNPEVENLVYLPLSNFGRKKLKTHKNRILIILSDPVLDPGFSVTFLKKDTGTLKWGQICF